MFKSTVRQPSKTTYDRIQDIYIYLSARTLPPPANCPLFYSRQMVRRPPLVGIEICTTHISSMIGVH